MSDIDEAMEETREKAQSRFGVGGSTAGEDARSSSGSDTSEASEALETSETEETSGTSETEDPADARAGPDPSGEEELGRGRLVDEYENVNIYIPGELKEELNVLFKQMDLEHSRETDGGLEKHWDFYPAVVRTVLRNEADLREELGIE